MFSRRHDAAHVLFRDYETRGVLALGKVGVHRYATDFQTEVLCCAFAVDDRPAKLWTPGEALPVEFREAASKPVRAKTQIQFIGSTITNAC